MNSFIHAFIIAHWAFQPTLHLVIIIIIILIYLFSVTHLL